MCTLLAILESSPGRRDLDTRSYGMDDTVVATGDTSSHKVRYTRATYAPH